MAAPQSLALEPSPATLNGCAPRDFQEQAETRPVVSPLPSTEQETAIVALLPFPQSDVLTWLNVIRSIEHLTKPQLDALALLSQEPGQYVRDWLALYHRVSGSVRSSQCSTLAESRLSSASSVTVVTFPPPASATLPEYPAKGIDLPGKSLHQNHAEDIHEEPSPKCDKPVPPLPKDAPYPVRHMHYSTCREHDRPMTTCDGFKRHEKERETYWVFLPDGPIEQTAHGAQCALCLTKDPDDEHLKEHDVLQYKHSKPFMRRSRPGEFIRLLKAHKVPEEHFDRLLDDRRRMRKKKAFSCGFCVSVFDELNKRLKHLCSEHFHKGQKMTEWETLNEIKGLLLQPEIERYLRETFDLDPSRILSISGLRGLEILQERLELGRETPYELAAAAFYGLRHAELLPSIHEDVNTAIQVTAVNTRSASANQNLIPSLSTSMLSTTNPPASSKMLPHNSTLYRQRTTPVDNETVLRPEPHSNTTFPRRTDSLPCHPIQSTITTSPGPANLADIDAMFATNTEWITEYDDAPTDNGMVEGNGIQIPPTTTDSPRERAFEDPSCDQWVPEIIDEYIQEGNQNPGYDAKPSSKDQLRSKRKLSEGTAAEANGTFQTLSPLGFRYEPDDF